MFLNRNDLNSGLYEGEVTGRRRFGETQVSVTIVILDTTLDKVTLFRFLMVTERSSTSLMTNTTGRMNHHISILDLIIEFQGQLHRAVGRGREGGERDHQLQGRGRVHWGVQVGHRPHSEGHPHINSSVSGQDWSTAGASSGTPMGTASTRSLWQGRSWATVFLSEWKFLLLTSGS